MTTDKKDEQILELIKAGWIDRNIANYLDVKHRQVVETRRTYNNGRPKLNIREKLMYGVIFLCLLSIPACELVDPETEVGQIDFYDFKNDIHVETMEDALIYVACNIEYKSDIGDYWQTPEETYTLKTGDCEDQTILLQYILQNKLKIPALFVGLLSTEQIGKGHAMVFADGLFLEATNGMSYKECPKSFTLMYTVLYSEVLWMAYNYHRYIK